MAGACCVGIAIGEGIIGGACCIGIAIGEGITEIGAMFTSPIITGCALDAGVASITLGFADARPAPIRAGFSMEGPSMGAG
jgi:hypothetical protein